MVRVGKSMDRKRNARRRQLSGAHTAESWNAAYPVGTRVRYWPVYPPHGIPPVDTTTRSEAWALGDGSAVVLIAGKSGGVWLSHVEVLPEPLAEARVTELEERLEVPSDVNDAFQEFVEVMSERFGAWCIGELREDLEPLQAAMLCERHGLLDSKKAETERLRAELAEARALTIKQAEMLTEADERLREVRRLLEENGCECPCDHHWEERGPDCEICLACLIGEAVGK
jgi:hypothetical protein